MKRTAFLSAAGMGLLAFAAAAAAGSASGMASTGDPAQDYEIQQRLIAMDNASTWGHPDMFGEFAGMHHYAAHDYEDAMKYFKYGARYADKLSQLSIGLMYENGDGVSKDPVTACAWTALAAERKYPSFIETRDRICKALTPAQHDQAVAMLNKLMPEYGDAVAKKRMARALHAALTEGTGSRLGGDSGIYQVRAKQACGGPTMYMAPQAGCGDTHFYDPGRWDPKEYFASRDAQWRGTVTVGSVNDMHGRTQTAQKLAQPAAASSTRAPLQR